MSTGEVRRASDGWYVLLRIQDVEHRLWLREPHVAVARYAAELPSTMTSRFASMPRADSGARSTGAPPVPPFMNCPHSVDSDWPKHCARSMAASKATAIARSPRACLAPSPSPNGPGKPAIGAIGPFVSCKAVLL